MTRTTEATTTATATTEPPASALAPARPRRTGASVRARITAAVAFLVMLALASAGVIIYVIESARLEAEARGHAEQEIAEFRTLESTGLDPTTAEPFRSAHDLLEVFMNRNVPSEEEMLVAWLDDGPRYVSAGTHGDLARDRGFADAVAGLLDRGGETVLDSARGEVVVTVQPVRESTGAEAALVVATFLDEARADLRALMRTYAVVSLLSLLVIVAVAAWQAGRLLAPLRTLNDTAREISETDLSARLPVSGNDDLTDLTVTFNQMLARLESAFAEQRQFLDDAGHELRTPLTVLRGHLELLDADDAAEVGRTRELLLDELDRMSRLVGDLILLAKSRRPDFLSPGPVDLGDLTHTLLAKARGLGERDWRLDSAGEGTVRMDEQRITQAVLQLADNAVKHTVEGDTVALGSELLDGVVRLWVRDTGPGVPVEDREHIFERFGRSVVAPDDEGFGLGLSIVQAIVAAHGGDVHVQDAEPHGSVFVITLQREEQQWPRS